MYTFRNRNLYTKYATMKLIRQKAYSMGRPVPKVNATNTEESSCAYTTGQSKEGPAHARLSLVVSN